MNSDHTPDDLMQTEILIGRIVDGEARPEDHQRFESLANADPLLWRRLALRQQDMAMLEAGVEHELRSAMNIELPDDAPRLRLSPRVHWLAAASGWAALIVVALAWAMTSLRANDEQHRRATHDRPAAVRQVSTSDEGENRSEPMTPDEHLREYLHAPFVLGEMAPTLLQVQELPDGRHELRILRRIEEIVYIDAADDVPVDAAGNLTKPPASLRDQW